MGSRSYNGVIRKKKESGVLVTPEGFPDERVGERFPMVSVTVTLDDQDPMVQATRSLAERAIAMGANAVIEVSATSAAAGTLVVWGIAVSLR